MVLESYDNANITFLNPIILKFPFHKYELFIYVFMEIENISLLVNLKALIESLFV